MGKRARLDDEMLRDGHAWAVAPVEAPCGFQSEKRQEAVDECIIDGQGLGPIVLYGTIINRSKIWYCHVEIGLVMSSRWTTRTNGESGWTLES